MAYREVSRMEIKEIIRRWQAGESPGRIAFGTGLSRNTVRKYLAATETQGIARDGPTPDDEQLRVHSGRGQDHTLRSLSALWSPVFAGEQDVGPPKG